ncbi:MAG TPA: helix-turn-helix domain-containing protein [Roseomonas sp.]|jgi:DNA-binding IclR family transcriptional regulator
MEEERPAASGTGSITRLLDILDLFTIEAPVVRVDTVQARLGYTKSTAYRYVKALCDAGLLAPAAAGSYSLGPRIVELDRLMRLADPLLRAGEAVLPALTAAVPNSMVLICSLYRDKVLCVHREGPEAIAAEGRAIRILRARGLPLPLFQGAASLAILAHLPQHRVRGLFLARRQEIGAAGLGEDWPALRMRLAAIRRDGHVTTIGRFNRHLAALSVPILAREDDRVVGSLTRIMAAPEFRGLAHDALLAELRAGAAATAAMLP